MLRSAKQLSKDTGHGKEFKLWQQWRDQARNGALGYVFLMQFGFDTLEAMREKEQVIVMQVSFDYNKRAFLPDEPPSLISIDALPQNEHSLAIRSTYRDNDVVSTKGKRAATFMVFLQCTTMSAIGAVLPLAMEEPGGDVASGSCTWDNLLFFLGEIKVKSSKFDSWQQLMGDNLKLQLNQVQRHPQFQSFLVSALRVESKNQRHKTHVVVATMNMGRGLGDIQSLVDYRVDPVNQVLEELSKSDIVAPETLAYYRMHYFDLENAPRLLQSRISHPKNVLLPVLFFTKGSALYVMPNMLEVFDDHNCYATSKCDKKAMQAFCELKKMELPAVTSPELH